MNNKVSAQLAESYRAPATVGTAVSPQSPSEYRLRMSYLSDLLEQAEFASQELNWSRETFGHKLEAFLAELRNLADVERAASRLISESLDDVESIRCVESAVRRLASSSVSEPELVKSVFSFDDREEVLVVGSARISAATDLIRLLTMRFGECLSRIGTSRDLLIAKLDLMIARRESMFSAWAAAAASNACYQDLAGPGGRIDAAFTAAERELESRIAAIESIGDRVDSGPKSTAA